MVTQRRVTEDVKVLKKTFVVEFHKLDDADHIVDTMFSQQTKTKAKGRGM